MKTSIARSFVCVVTIVAMFVVVAGVANAQPASGLSQLERIARKQAENAIIAAVKKDDLDAVAACVTKDRTLINTVDDSKDGQTLVHLAVKAENLTLLKCLIAWEANLETPDKNGKTPLKVAVEAKKVAAVLYLLANEADAKDVTDGELAALPLGDLSNSQYISKYIVEKSEKEVERLIAEDKVARDAADEEAAAEKQRQLQAAADAAKEAEKERIRREQEAVAEKERQRKEAEEKQKEIQQLLDAIAAGDTDKRVQILRDNGVLVRDKLDGNGKKAGDEFYFVSNNASNAKISLGLNCSDKVKACLKYNITEKMYEFDIHKKMLVLDKNVVDLLGGQHDRGAKIIIHGTLFGANPDHKVCGFNSKEFENLCESLQKSKSELREFKADGWSAVQLARAAVGDRALWGLWDTNEIKNSGFGIRPADVNTIASGSCFVFDTVKKGADGTYYLDRIDHFKGQSGMRLVKIAIEHLVGNPNPYLKR